MGYSEPLGESVGDGLDHFCGSAGGTEVGGSNVVDGHALLILICWAKVRKKVVEL